MAVEITVPEGTCQDGCGQAVNKGRRFRQGHDARLRGILGRAYRGGEEVAFVMNGTRKASSAEAALKQHGFPIPPARKASTRKPAAKKATAKRTAKRTTRKPRARKAAVAK